MLKPTGCDHQFQYWPHSHSAITNPNMNWSRKRSQLIERRSGPDFSTFREPHKGTPQCRREPFRPSRADCGKAGREATLPRGYNGCSVCGARTSVAANQDRRRASRPIERSRGIGSYDTPRSTAKAARRFRRGRVACISSRHRPWETDASHPEYRCRPWASLCDLAVPNATLAPDAKAGPVPRRLVNGPRSGYIFATCNLYSMTRSREAILRFRMIPGLLFDRLGFRRRNVWWSEDVPLHASFDQARVADDRC